MTDTTHTPRAKKSRPPFWIVAFLIALGVLAFLMFRPVTPAEEVVQDDGEAKVYDPVTYDTQNWASTPKQTVDFEVLKAMLGTTATTEMALDFYGNHADRYRFSNKTEPPFYLIESDEVFEVAWYYAAPKDDERQKDASIAYAKKAHAMMGAYLGEAGERLVENMLHTPSQSFAKPSLGVIAADCMDYHCRIVLQK